jgi:hypothetical protein
MRLKDREGPNGEKLLHLEELQSDWHQEGRKKGYHDPEKLAQSEATIQALKAEHKRLGEVKALAQTPKNERPSASNDWQSWARFVMQPSCHPTMSPTHHSNPTGKRWHLSA